VWQQRERLDRLNVKLAVISFEKREGDLALPGDTERGGTTSFYLDEDRTLYGYFGMHQAGFLDLWGLKSLWIYLRLIGKGRKMRRSTGDVYQRGGDVLLDPEAIVRFHRVADGPADRPDPETLLRIVEDPAKIAPYKF
jgi:hypothetical protein